jgi:hypothetical protein
MPDSSSPRRLRRLPEILVVVALLAGGAFFWANKQTTGGAPASSSSEAFAAPRGAAPQRQSVRPKPASAAQRADAIKTIGGQLHAFDIGDWDSAVAFQSQGLRSNFSSPAQFGQMIQRAYPAFVRARHVDFGNALASGPVLEMDVQLTTRDGQKVRTQYMLFKEEGHYRVASVMGGAPSAPGHNRQPDENNDSGGIVV